MKNGGIQRAGLFLMILLILFMSFAIPCQAASEKDSHTTQKIRVGCALSTGYHQKNADGKISGYGYSYEKLLSQYAGWDIEYVEGSWKDLQEMLSNGEIDLLGFLVETPERDEKYDFSRIPAGQSMSCLAVKKDSTRYAYQDYASFDGMRVACIRSNANVDAFLAYTSEHGFSVDICYYDTYADVFAAVDDGSVEACLATNYQELSNFRGGDQFLAMDYHYCVKKGNTELMAELNEAMSDIDSFYTNIEDTLYSQYYDRNNGMNAAFTSAERAYLDTSPVVTVVPCGRQAPFEAYDETTDTYTGIVPDILEQLTKVTGIEFRYVHTEDRWLFQKEDLGENVITCFSEDTDWVDGKGLYITQPFLESNVSVIQKDIPKGDVTVAVQENTYLWHLAQQEHPEWIVQDYDTKEECLDAVKDGTCTSTLLNSYEADYFLSRGRYNTLKEETMAGVIQYIGFGITVSSNENLLPILSKAMLMVPSDEYDAIIRTNANETADATFVDLIYKNPVEMVGIISLICILLMAAVGMLFYVRSIRKKNREVLEANAAKTDFLSRVSHDLRTPMNAIINLTNMVEEEIDDKDSALEDIGKIKTSNQFLLSLINDVLDVSKIEEKKMELHPERYPYNDFLNYIQSTFEPLCKEKNITFTITKGEEKPDILIDRIRFNQLCFNLLSNAVKYTPEGGHVSLDMVHGDIENGRFSCDIYVKDDGVGMSREFQEKMCEPFSQEGREFKSVEGTGLGLYIVKQIVSLLQGTFEVTSEVGQGTSVHVHLMMEIAPYLEDEQKQEKTDIGILQDKHILVVEDHPLNAEIVKRLLEKKGCKVTCATDGKQGVDAVKNAPEHTFDMILMDIRMPVMDGIEAAEEIRRLKREDTKSVPIIAMSANAYVQDVQKSLQAGMNGHLAKPVDPKLLYQTMANTFIV